MSVHHPSQDNYYSTIVNPGDELSKAKNVLTLHCEQKRDVDLFADFQTQYKWHVFLYDVHDL